MDSTPVLELRQYYELLSNNKMNFSDKPYEQPPPSCPNGERQAVVCCECRVHTTYRAACPIGGCVCRTEVFIECRGCSQRKEEAAKKLAEERQRKYDAIAGVHKKYF